MPQHARIELMFTQTPQLFMVTCPFTGYLVHYYYYYCLWICLPLLSRELGLCLKVIKSYYSKALNAGLPCVLLTLEKVPLFVCVVVILG
jgi:hypothetical protein